MMVRINWVNCPICDEPDMQRITDGFGNSLIFCTNHACNSNVLSKDRNKGPMYDPKELDEFLEGAIGLVEANSNEQHQLWYDYHGFAQFEKRKTNKYGQPPVAWEGNGVGLMETVGYIDNRPVCVCLYKAKVNGHLIVFWDATSQVVDHKMIDRWIDERMPKSMRDENDRVNKTDATNFSNIFRR